MSTVPTVSIRALNPQTWEPVYNGTCFLYDLQATAQRVQQSLKLFTNEWFLNLSLGLNIFGSSGILGTPATSQNQELYANLIVQNILSVPYVTGVSNVVTAFTSSTRQFSFSCSVATQFGVFYLSNFSNYPTPPSAVLNAG